MLAKAPHPLEAEIHQLREATIASVGVGTIKVNSADWCAVVKQCLTWRRTIKASRPRKRAAPKEKIWKRVTVR